LTVQAKKVAVIGFGNIGTGVVDILYRRQIPGLELVRVVDINLETERPVKLPARYLSQDWQEAVHDPEVDIIVELIGGLQPAKDIQIAALEHGKEVVTANKSLLAQEGHQVFPLAGQRQRRIGFRACFVGCHPLIHEFGQAGAEVKKFRRIFTILNGTSNYILTTMAQEGKDFAAALREAQHQGFAESDPTEDIDGIDTANKIRIVLSLISNCYQLGGLDCYKVQGIREITAEDIRYAAELGYAIKPVGVIEHQDGVFRAGVYPALVARASLLGSLEGAYNGTEVEDEYGTVSGLVTPGAGTYPTADAVIKDLMDIAAGKPMPMPTSAGPLVLASTAAEQRRYYLRFSAVDQPGVLAQICNIFWEHNISIAAVIQKEATSEEFVPIVMTTHLAEEGALHQAITRVDTLDVVKAKTNIIRILPTAT